MAVWAIGDVQGCHAELVRLLDRLRIDPARDELWFVGDLVNRGPHSLEVLRLVRSLGRTAIVVLGNHDLHLLAAGLGGSSRRTDPQLRTVLDAPDAGELLDWLRMQPLAHYRPDLATLMVHAGVAAPWDARQTVALAGEVEAQLRGTRCAEFLGRMYGDEPSRWSADLAGIGRQRYIVNCLTRMRYCHPDGRLDLEETGAPGSQPPPLLPWFDMPARATEGVRVVFGHWSALGLLQRKNLLCLDTGCVWGRTLTAARLDGALDLVEVPAV